jgi:putative nucleotidyltransferase with HDIG domain
MIRAQVSEKRTMGIPGDILDGIDRLEPLPMTVQKLILMLDDEEVDLAEVARIIELDGAITSNVLRLANSAAFGGISYIRKTHNAVVRLGTATLLDILLIGHLRSMRVAAPHYNLSEDDLWLHGAAASLAAKATTKEARRMRIPQVATVASLIHDIGKLIMVRYLKADVPSLYDICHEQNITLVQAERQVLDCDHAEVGGAMARKWSFPEPIIQGIELHHRSPAADGLPILDTVMIANEVAKLVAAGMEVDGTHLHPDIADSCRRLSIDGEGFRRICSTTAAWLADLKLRYGIEN